MNLITKSQAELFEELSDIIESHEDDVNKFLDSMMKHYLVEKVQVYDVRGTSLEACERRLNNGSNGIKLIKEYTRLVDDVITPTTKSPAIQSNPNTMLSIREVANQWGTNYQKVWGMVRKGVLAASRGKCTFSVTRENMYLIRQSEADRVRAEYMAR
jgi:hypothetical protein